MTDTQRWAIRLSWRPPGNDPADLAHGEQVIGDLVRLAVSALEADLQATLPEGWPTPYLEADYP